MRRKVYIVGAGPGRPDLITVRGLAILRAADVVIYDSLIERRILDYAREGAELICCPRGDRDKCLQLLIKRVNQGRKVVRLKNGDPTLFARCAQELAALVKERIEFELVPGITAANAASCLSGIPLTERSRASSCVLVTAQEEAGKEESLIDWKALSRSGTIIVYMARGNLKDVVKKLLQAGRREDTPVACVQDVSLPTQRVLTAKLQDIALQAAQQRIRPPVIVIIGEVVKLERDFNWLKKGKRILFTGLSPERYFSPGSYFHLPLIKIEPLRSYAKFDNYVRNIREFDWIVFASRYGVEYFFNRLKQVGQDARALHNIRIAAIGDSTRRRLLDFSMRADLLPKKESSTGLIAEFKKIDLKDKKIFLPRSDISDKGLAHALTKLGAQVTTCFAYRNVMPGDLPALDLSFFDEIIFTSPSTVRNFKQRYKDIPCTVKIKCIGEVTRKEAKRCRLLD